MMRLGVGVLLFVSSASVAQTTDLAAAFGARQGVVSASLSPDGTKVALVASGTGSQTRVFVVDTTNGAVPKQVLVSSGKPESVYWCRWVSNARLVCQIGGLLSYQDSILGFSTMMAVNADGTNQRVISKQRGLNQRGFDLRGGTVIDYLPEGTDSVLMTRSYVPEGRIGVLVASDAEGLGVDRVNTVTGTSARVERPSGEAVEYITDGYGAVRIKGLATRNGDGYATGKYRYLYRPNATGEWMPLSIYDGMTRTGFNPFLVDQQSNLAYGLEKMDGRQALVSYTLSGSPTRSVVYASPSVDVDGPVRIGRRARIVGATFATDRRTNVYFDPKIKATTAALSKALGGKGVYVVDSDQTESKLLLWAGSDTDPGQYYLYDSTARKLSPILPERPQLQGMTLGTVQSISYPAADGTMVPAYLTLPPGKEAKNLPAIVLPHGGPSARDEWGFDWLSQYLVARGFAVIQPNFRGSAGYGDAWFKENGFRSWRTAIGDVAAAGRYLTAKGIADPAKLTILGWSYGGYAALQAAVTEPGLFKAVVAIAPVTDLETLIGKTRESDAYYLMRDYVGTGPHIVEGSPARNAAKITAPVLMFQGTMDANVDQAQARLMDEKLHAAGKRSELVIFEGLDHQLDDADARKTLLQRSADFLLAAGK